MVEQLEKVVHHDWRHSHPLDLSDEGIRADLQERAEVAEQLGIVDVRPGEGSA